MNGYHKSIYKCANSAAAAFQFHQWRDGGGRKLSISLDERSHVISNRQVLIHSSESFSDANTCPFHELIRHTD